MLRCMFHAVKRHPDDAVDPVDRNPCAGKWLQLLFTSVLIQAECTRVIFISHWRKTA